MGRTDADVFTGGVFSSCCARSILGNKRVLYLNLIMLCPGVHK